MIQLPLLFKGEKSISLKKEEEKEEEEEEESGSVSHTTKILKNLDKHHTKVYFQSWTYDFMYHTTV